MTAFDDVQIVAALDQTIGAVRQMSEGFRRMTDEVNRAATSMDHWNEEWAKLPEDIRRALTADIVEQPQP